MSGGGFLDAARKAALESWLAAEAGAHRVAVTDEGRLSGGAISLNLAVTLDIDGGPLAGRHAGVLRTGSASGVSASLGKPQEAAGAEARLRRRGDGAGGAVRRRRPGPAGRPLLRHAAGGRRRRRLPPGEKRRAPARIGARAGSSARPHPRGAAGAPGLEFLPLPASGAALQCVADYRGWMGRFAATDPVLAHGLRWLTVNAPEPGELVLCHRDYRTGNYMVENGALTAIIDWEFAGWSDPMEDLGWFCAASWRFGRNDREAGGIADRADLYAGYEETSGRRVDDRAVAYWETAAYLRWAAIALQQGMRHTSGTEPSLELALTGRMLPEIELDLLRHLDAVAGLFAGGPTP